MLLDVVGLSSSSFYYQLHAMARRDKYCQLRKDIAAIAGESFHTYGYCRIWHVLRVRVIRVSEKVVRKIISEDKILVRYPRRKRRYSSYNGEIAPAPENLVKRNFHTNAPGKLWLTDITEFITTESKLYISAVIDCFDGKIVGWASGRHPSNEIVMASMNMALEEPISDNSLIIHSDRGSHYRGGDFAAFLRCHHIIQSMSKKGVHISVELQKRQLFTIYYLLWPLPNARKRIPFQSSLTVKGVAAFIPAVIAAA